MTKKKAKRDLLPVGRPTVFTPNVVRKLEEAFMMDATDGEGRAGEDGCRPHQAGDPAVR
jgi:hypothetical protein